MGKRFTPTHLADDRAIKFHLRLCEIARDFPLVRVVVREDKKILIQEVSELCNFNELSVEAVLSLDLKAAKQAGGTRRAFMLSQRLTKLRVPQATVDETVQDFLTCEAAGD